MPASSSLATIGGDKMAAAPLEGLQKPTSLQQTIACEMETRGPNCNSPDKDKKQNSDLNTS